MDKYNFKTWVCRNVVIFVFWKLFAQSGAARPAPGLLGLKYQIKLSATPYYFSWATACQPAAGSDGSRNWGDNNHQSQPTIRLGPGSACRVLPSAWIKNEWVVICNLHPQPRFLQLVTELGCYLLHHQRGSGCAHRSFTSMEIFPWWEY